MSNLNSFRNLLALTTLKSEDEHNEDADMVADEASEKPSVLAIFARICKCIVEILDQTNTQKL